VYADYLAVAIRADTQSRKTNYCIFQEKDNFIKNLGGEPENEN
jgi:hypothetical protein